MLRSFRVENHKSIRDEQELSFLPVYDKTRPVVPVAAIFGANASGKSNLLDALRWMRDGVLDSYAAWRPGDGVPRTPFRLDPEAAARPSGYVVDIVVDGDAYTYGFEVDDERVSREWLYTYPHSRKRLIFERDGREIEFGSTVGKGRWWARTLSKMTRENALLLDVAARSNQPDVMAAYHWFRAGLLDFHSEVAVIVERLMQRLKSGGRSRQALVDLVAAADLGITDIYVSDLPDLLFTGEGIDRQLQKLRFVHAPTATVMNVEDESAGTVTWLKLASAALDVLDGGSVLLVDELDESMHPRVTAALVELFRYQDTNPRDAQLVFTTHDTTLLSPILGADPVQRDEVWFVEKDGTGATKLFPLSDFKPRKLENWERRYLTGAYGAVPMASQYAFQTPVEDYHQSSGNHAAA